MLAAAQGRRPRLAARRRRRGLQRPRARPDLRAQDLGRGVARRHARRPRRRAQVQRHHALRSRRDGRRSSPTTWLRLRELQDETGGFNAFIPLSFQPANTGLSELPGPDRLRRPQDARRRPPRARQLPPHQGVLDQRRPQARPGLAVVRGQRPRRHGGRGEDQPRGRRRHRPGAQPGRARARDPRRRPRAGRARHALQRRAALRMASDERAPDRLRSSARRSGCRRAVRVGRIEFVNCFPLYCHFVEELRAPGRRAPTIVEGHPAALNRLLVDGAIDVALPSSIAFARHADALRAAARRSRSARSAPSTRSSSSRTCRWRRSQASR